MLPTPYLLFAAMIAPVLAAPVPMTASLVTPLDSLATRPQTHDHLDGMGRTGKDTSGVTRVKKPKGNGSKGKPKHGHHTHNHGQDHRHQHSSAAQSQSVSATLSESAPASTSLASSSTNSVDDSTPASSTDSSPDDATLASATDSSESPELTATDVASATITTEPDASATDTAEDTDSTVVADVDGTVDKRSEKLSAKNSKSKSKSKGKSKTSTKKAKSSTKKPKPSPTAKVPITQQTSGTVSGGVATFFFQGGQAGACGTVHQDTDLIAAIDKDRYGDLGAVSPLCGTKVKVTNTKNGKSVTVTIADACPTCENGQSIDLSQRAFDQIATEEEGEVPVTLTFLGK